MAIPLNSVFKVANDRLCRLLWSDPGGYGVWIIDIRYRKAQPELWNRQDLVDRLAFGEIELAPDPYAEILIPNDLLPEKYRRYRDRAWAKIGGLVKQVPDIFVPKKRARLIKETIAQRGGTYLTINRQIRRYLQRGCVPQALVPDYRNCGGRGLTKNVGCNKRGRPRKKKNRGTGINITPKILAWMRVSWVRVITSKNTTISQGYYWFLETYFSEYVEVRLDANNRVSVEILDHDQVPTADQYYYYYQQENSYEARCRRRVGSHNFDLNYRNIVGSSLDGVLGPGSRYEIDATIGDVYLVSPTNRMKVIGRPTIYLVKDVFSRMIVGMYVGLESPCWAAAGLALLNCVEDKVKYASRFGIVLGPDEWPVAEFPARVLGDRGEMERHLASVLASDLGTDIENTVAYQPDDKGGIECGFRIMHVTIRSELPGYVDTEYTPRDGKDYVLDAKMTLAEITAIIIFAALKANTAIKKGYKTNPEMIADGIPYVPIQIWHWGKAKYLSEGRYLDQEYVMKCLLPRTEVIITDKGIQLKPNVIYANDEMLEQAWYFKARSTRQVLTASYHLGDMNYIYVRDPIDNTKWYKCHLSAHSTYCENQTYIEIEALRDDERDIQWHGKKDALGRSMGYDLEMGELKRKAIDQAAQHSDATTSKSQRVREMPEERRKELERSQKERAEHLNGSNADYTTSEHSTTSEDVDNESAEERFNRFRNSKPKP